MYGPYHQYLQNFQEEIQGSIMWKEISLLCQHVRALLKPNISFQPKPQVDIYHILNVTDYIH